MSKSIKTRLEKLEAASHPGQRLIVVEGHSDKEHRTKIDSLKASGAASERDLFVCIMRFSEPLSDGERA